MAKKRTPVNPSLDLFGLGLIAVAIAAVVIVAIIFWRGDVTVVITEGGGAEVELTLTQRQVDFNGLLDKLLNENDDSKRQLALAVLRTHHLYLVPSAEAAGALREIEETEAKRDFARGVRAALYDLAGPFSRPRTFLEAHDDRVLSAFDDLLPSSPLVTKLWEMSLNLEGIFVPREINVSIHEDHALKKRIAAAYAGSVLLNKICSSGSGGQDRISRSPA
jgi:hypothetical protein